MNDTTKTVSTDVRLSSINTSDNVNKPSHYLSNKDYAAFKQYQASISK